MAWTLSACWQWLASDRKRRVVTFPRARSISIMTRLLLAAVLIPAIAQTAPSPNEQTKPDFAGVRKYIQDHIAAESLPSLAIAVARDGKIIWEEGFGWADRENSIKSTAHTPYYLASVTKSLTSTAVMLLQERHKLDLDRPVNDYLGAAKVHSPMWDASQATVRRVATHTAGLTTYARDCAVNDPGCRASTETAIERYGTLFWPPGDHFDYSNLGYGILGDVVAHASGKSYGEFLHDEVFQPLGMSDCALELPPELRKRAAAQYDQTSHTRSPLRNSDHPGASAVHCSVHDLALFGMFIVKARVPGQKAVLSEESRDAMLNSTVNAVDGQRYGIGWWENPNLNGYTAVFGSGGTSDSAATLYTIPSEGIVVAALANTGTLLADKAAQEVLSGLLPKFREQREKSAQSVKPPEVSPNTPAKLAGKWTGEIQTWRGLVPLTLSISPTREIHAGINSKDHALQNAGLQDNELYGVFEGDVGTPDAPRPPYNIEIDLYLRGDTLAGAATTRGDGPALPYWVTLRKAH